MSNDAETFSKGTLWHGQDRKRHEIFPGAYGSFSHSDRITIASWELEQNAVVPEHSHGQEQWVCMISGTFQMKINDEMFTLHDGDILHIPSHAVHSGRTLSDVRCIDVFNPPRDDYRK